MTSYQDNHQDLNPAYIMELRASFAEVVSHIPSETRFQAGELLAKMATVNGQRVQHHQLRYLREQQLIQPIVDDGGGRSIYWYNRDILVDMLVITTLQSEHQASLTLISNLLRSAEKKRSGRRRTIKATG
ncbi:MAG: hypothetical protein AAF629_36185 [Chloroflexota bacterium]